MNATDHPTVPGSNAPAEDGPHPFETRPETPPASWGLHPQGCDYCGQVESDPIHNR